MNNRFEFFLHLATALVTGFAPFFLDPLVCGLLLAAISLAHAADIYLDDVANRPRTVK